MLSFFSGLNQMPNQLALQDLAHRIPRKILDYPDAQRVSESQDPPAVFDKLLFADPASQRHRRHGHILEPPVVHRESGGLAHRMMRSQCIFDFRRKNVHSVEYHHVVAPPLQHQRAIVGQVARSPG